MHTATFNRAISRRRRTVATLLACALAAGGVSPSLPAADAAAARDLTVEQTAIFTVQAPAPAMPYEVVGRQRAGATRLTGRGLARVEPSGETLAAYAAKAGTVASDGFRSRAVRVAGALD